MCKRGLRFSCIVLFAVLIGFGGLGARTQAQDATLEIVGRLVYVRTVSADTLEIVSLTAEAEYQVEVPADHCYVFSRDFQYVAVAAKTTPDTLSVFRFDGRLVLETPWLAAWGPTCDGSVVRWAMDNEHLKIITTKGAGSLGTDPREYILISVTDGTISGPHTYITTFNCSWAIYQWHDLQDVCADLSAELPNLILDDTHIEFSPNRRYVLYDYCISGEVGWNGWYDVEECIGPSQAVIYDRLEQDIVVELVDAPELQPDHRLGGMVWGAYKQRWSPSSRFLVYERRDLSLESTALIFDVIARQYVAAPTLPADFRFPVSGSSFRWSPDESKILFWLCSYLIPITMN